MPLTSITNEERIILRQVNSVDDLLQVSSQFVTVTKLKLESQKLADSFIAANMAYISHIIGIELNDAQKADVLEEIGKVGWLTMADFKLFLDEMKRHKFFRRDYQELIAEFWKYADRRLERAFEIEQAKNDNFDPYERTKEVNKIDQIKLMQIKAERKAKGL